VAHLHLAGAAVAGNADRLPGMVRKASADGPVVAGEGYPYDLGRTSVGGCRQPSPSARARAF